MYVPVWLGVAVPTYHVLTGVSPSWYTSTFFPRAEIRRTTFGSAASATGPWIDARLKVFKSRFTASSRALNRPFKSHNLPCSGRVRVTDLPSMSAMKILSTLEVSSTAKSVPSMDASCPEGWVYNHTPPVTAVMKIRT